MYFVECPRIMNVPKRTVPSVRRKTLGKEASLPSAKAWRSAKITVVNYGRLLTALCRAPPFAECSTLVKISLPSVFLCRESCSR
jgi:hypothetical protein